MKGPADLGQAEGGIEVPPPKGQDLAPAHPGREGDGRGGLHQRGRARTPRDEPDSSGFARRDGTPAFLETARPENVGYYERLGFHAPTSTRLGRTVHLVHAVGPA